MKSNTPWPLEAAQRHPRTWKISSKICISAVGLISKFWCRVLNKTDCVNMDKLMDLVKHREEKVGLITVSNHHSCLDDPVLFGNMPLSILTYTNEKMRWALGASEICFTNKLFSYFFALGRVLPVIRGNGVFQPSMQYILQRLNEGSWVHLFVEGGVNETHEKKRIKWGVGRLIEDADTLPIILPIWHCGMDDILPNKTPYVPRVGKKVTLVVGKPLYLNGLLQQLRETSTQPQQIWKGLADKIQEELHKLQDEAERIHNRK